MRTVRIDWLNTNQKRTRICLEPENLRDEQILKILVSNQNPKSEQPRIPMHDGSIAPTGARRRAAVLQLRDGDV